MKHICHNVYVIVGVNVGLFGEAFKFFRQSKVAEW